jgi:hypothetical protein
MEKKDSAEKAVREILRRAAVSVIESATHTREPRWIRFATDRAAEAAAFIVLPAQRRAVLRRTWAARIQNAREKPLWCPARLGGPLRVSGLNSLGRSGAHYM